MASLELPEGLETAHPIVGDNEEPDLEDFPGGFKPDNSCGILACSSLVNLVLPLHQPIKGIREIATERSFLRRLRAFEPAVDNYDDLVYKLKHRFDNCPLHKLCYYQSYYPLAETMEKFKTLLEADPSTSKKGCVWDDSTWHCGVVTKAKSKHAASFDSCRRQRSNHAWSEFVEAHTDGLLSMLPLVEEFFSGSKRGAVQDYYRPYSMFGFGSMEIGNLESLENAFALDKEARQFTPENMRAVYSKIEHSERIKAISLLKQAVGKAAVCVSRDLCDRDDT